MDFIEIMNIQRKDSPIHYINEYHCDLVFTDSSARKTVSIEIIIEKTAFGTTEFRITPLDDSDKLEIKQIEDFVRSKYEQGYFE